MLDFDSALESLEALTEQMGGYCESSELYNYGANRTAAYTVRVPNESYRSFLDCCADWENCYLISRSENVEDVGEAYFDAENRLNTLQTKLERLQELLRQASEMEDIITIESEISDTEYEIEQYTSTLNRYDSLVDYATIRVDLTEVVDLSEDEEIGLLARLGQNLRWGAENLRDALEELLLWLAYHFFQLLLLTAAAAAVLLIVRGKRRGRRKKQSAGQEANRQDGEPPEQT